MSHGQRPGEPVQTSLDHRPGSAAVPLARPPRQARDHADQADGDAARPVARLFARRRRAGQSDPRRSLDRVRLYRARQHGRGHHQRHCDPRPRQSRRARRQAGDGRQGGAVQALRRHRFDRSGSRHRGPRSLHQQRALSRALVRRHQSRGHQGAGVLHHRGAPARTDGHSRSSTTTSTAPRSSPPPA